MSEADFASGDLSAMDRVGAIAHEAERRGFESTGVSAFRDASLLASRMMDYRTATYWMGQGLRYADSIEQSFCAHVLRAESALVAWATFWAFSV